MDILFSSNLELILRLILAVIFGGLIGLERELLKKTAGLKTFALVSLGSALFTIISILIFRVAFEITEINPIQLVAIPAAVVSGIGFIGAGLIIFHGSHVSGITTAAGLWVSAAVGMAVGFGFYKIAGFATFLTVIIFVLFWILEEKLIRKLNILNEDEKHS